ncbi:MAG: hypothetical protein Q9200_004258 [Gallowayella weberi]
MASLSRRACYKCGNVGHYAGRSCSRFGPIAASLTLSQRFVHLQSVFAIIANNLRGCPNAFGGGPPLGAGRGGFMARGGYGGGFRGGFPGGPGAVARPATCYKCGGPNHYARDCQAQAMKCYACGKLGHISRECTAPNGGPLTSAGKACYKCGQPGHISRECTVVETNGPMGLDTAVDPINQVQPSATAAAAV